MATLNFNQDQCILCGQCVEKCPFGALEILDNKIEINASCKMCKLCVKSCPVQAVSLVEDAVKQTVDKDAWKGVMVFVEQEESGIHPVAFELIGKARELAAKINHPVYAVLIGGGQAKEQAQTLLEYGVDKVYVYAHEALAHFRGDVYTNIMEDCIKTVKPTVILVGATSLGRSLAPACATRFRTGLTADCTVLDMKENTDLVQIRPAFGGNIMAQIITTNTRPQFATVRYKVMNVAEKTEPNGEVVTCEVTDEMLKSGMEVISTEIAGCCRPWCEKTGRFRPVAGAGRCPWRTAGNYAPVGGKRMERCDKADRTFRTYCKTETDHYLWRFRSGTVCRRYGWSGVHRSH